MSPQPPPPQAQFPEVHVPVRPALGRLESTRLRTWLDAFAPLQGHHVTRQLARQARDTDATCIHTVAHAGEFWPALLAARRLGLPYFLTAHDHVRYALQGSPLQGLTLRRLGEAWRSAQHCFVISEALGRDYCALYGERSFTIVTDGIDGAPRPHERRPSSSLRVYFAGAFHLAYEENLRALLAALEGFRARNSQLDVKFTCRCGSLPAQVMETTIVLRILPFGEEGVVQSDIEDADLLYLPLPFGDRHGDLNRFSLSTKAITYMGSGRPILYHGPAESALGELLARHDAAIMIPSLEPEAIESVLQEGLTRAAVVTENAGRLAREQFRLEDQRARFWSAIEAGAAR